MAVGRVTVRMVRGLVVDGVMLAVVGVGEVDAGDMLVGWWGRRTAAASSALRNGPA